MDNRFSSTHIASLIGHGLYERKTSLLLRVVVGALVSLIFLQYFIEGLVLHKLMIKLDLSNARLSELLQLQDSGQLDVKVALWISLAIFIAGVAALVPVIRMVRSRPLVPLTLIVFIFLSTLVLVLRKPEEIIPQIGRDIRYINSLLFVPFFIFMATRRVGARALIKISAIFFYAGYLFCAITILSDLLGRKEIAEVGFRYSVLLGSATAQAALFTGALAVTFFLRGVSAYKQLPRVIRLSAESLTFFSAIAIIVLTGSRGPFLAASITVLCYAFLQRRNNLTFIMIVACVPVAATLAALFDLTPLLDYFSSRSGLDISTGRTEIWANAISQMGDFYDFILGYNVDTAPHNTFLGIFVTYGFAAFLVFVGLQLQIFQQTLSRIGKFDSREVRELVCRAVSIQVGILTYGMYENFFFLNNGLLMLVYYSLFGLCLVLPFVSKAPLSGMVGRHS